MNDNESFVSPHVAIVELTTTSALLRLRVKRVLPGSWPSKVAYFGKDYRVNLSGLQQYENLSAPLPLEDLTLIREHLSDAYKEITSLRGQVADLKIQNMQLCSKLDASEDVKP